MSGPIGADLKILVVMDSDIHSATSKAEQTNFRVQKQKCEATSLYGLMKQV